MAARIPGTRGTSPTLKGDVPHARSGLVQARLTHMSRRFVPLVVLVAISLQGPILAYAGAVTAKTVTPACAAHLPGHDGADDSCCPQGILPGLCCAGGLVLTAVPSAAVTVPAVPLHLMPLPAGFVAFATERPAPLLRPPIP
jgi:hypothetical protein